jgi:signal transduction histidine kinase
LTVICGYVQLLIDDLAQPAYGAGGAETLDYLDIIAKNAKRCQEMSHMWKSLAKPDTISLQPVHLAGLVSEVVAGARLAADRSATRIEVAAGPSDCVVMADSVQLFRALQNLLTNAVQSMDEAGGLVRLSWEARSGVVTIEIADTGGGIPEALLDKIFEPSFTTKARSGGMGLGLFITRKIVELHNGTIALANRPEGGAVATIRLPLAGG